MKTKHLLVSMIVSLAVMTVAKAQSVSSSYSWASLPFGGGGFVTGILASEQEANVIYVRTDVGGAYRWIESTKSWKPLNDDLSEDDCGLMGAESMALDPNKPSRIYMYCGTSYFSGGKSVIMRSDNYGDTWNVQSVVTSQFPSNGNSGGRQSGERLAVDPNDGTILLCGSRSRGIWKSTDGAQHWTRVGSEEFPNDQKVAFVKYIASSGRNGEATPVVYAGLLKAGITNLYLSNDGGTNWFAVKGQRTDYMPHRCTVDGNIMYITYTDNEGPNTGGSGAIMKYDMNTGIWTDISPAAYSFGEVSVVKGKSDYLMTTSLGKWLAINWRAGGTSWGDQIFLSRNGGKTWTNLMTSKLAKYVENEITWQKNGGKLHWCGSSKIDPFNANRAFFIAGNGLYATGNLWDANPVFHMAEKGLEETVPLDLCSVPGAPFAVCIGDYDGALYDDIVSYPARYNAVMGSNSDIAIAPLSPQMMIRTGGSIYASTDGGGNWNKLTISGVTSDTYINTCAISSEGHVMVVTPKGSKPYYTIDGGQTWTMINDAVANAVFHGDGATEGVFYSFFNSKLYVFHINVQNGALSYTSTAFTGANNTRRACIVPGLSGDIWVTMGSNGITHLQNADQGAGAIKTTNIALSRATCMGVGKSANPGGYPTLFIWGKPTSSDAIGLYRSENKGVNWVRINDDQHQFGGPGNAQQVTGDMNVYGRVYMSTVGRGVICGEYSGETSAVSSVVASDGLDGLTNGRIYDIYKSTGELIEQGFFSEASNVGEGLPKGVYILRVINGDHIQTHKFIR